MPSLKTVSDLTLSNFVAMESVQSVMLGVTLYSVAYLISEAVSKNQSIEVKRFWKLTTRNIATAGFVLGLGVIWRAELQSVLVALGAAAAGFLIGFKEQWQSMLAFWVRVVKRQYALDDFIEVDGIRGRVIDITWLTTTLAEIGSPKDALSYTGRMVHVPNVRMIMANVAVDNFTGEYSVHSFVVPLRKSANVLKAESQLLLLAKRYCEPFQEKALKHMKILQAEQNFDTPGTEPRTRLSFGSDGVVTVIVRLVAPATERARIEQQILHDFLKNATEDVFPRKNVKD